MHIMLWVLVLTSVIKTVHGFTHFSNDSKSFQDKLSFESQMNENRRTILSHCIGFYTYFFNYNPIAKAYPNENLASLGVEGINGRMTRVEGIGGGFDIRSSMIVQGQDVIYPASLIGDWNVSRIVTLIEGDYDQAEKAWRLLGGGRKDIRETETYSTRFITPPREMGIQNSYVFDGAEYQGVILDRGYDLEQRIHTPTIWDNTKDPNHLSYHDDKTTENTVNIDIVKRKIELPSENGWGFNELYRVTSSAGGGFAKNSVERAIRVQRRFRRSLDGEGKGIVEGLEIAKTYRVLDGVAGIEMPTSTLKCMIQLSR